MNQFIITVLKKIALTIGRVLRAKLIRPKEVKLKMLTEYELIGFGSGVYFTKFHKNLNDFTDRIPHNYYKKAFVFSTSGTGLSTTNKELVRFLKAKGFDVIGDFVCKGWDTYGPFKLIGGLAKGRPNSEDLKNAERFAQSLKK